MESVAPLALLFLKSLWIGLSIAAPVGPIGLLTIQRTLDQGTRIGLATGLGAAAADACYGAVGAFGSRLVIDALTQARPVLLALGCGVLLWMAWSLWRAPLADRAATPHSGSSSGRLWRSFSSTFLLTLSNPSTIFSFMAIFGALAAGSAIPAAPAPMIAGVFVGSALWWLLLCTGVGRWRARFDDRWRRRINRVSALMLAGLAVWQVAAALA